MDQVCSDVRDAAKKHDTYNQISTISIITGGVIAIGTVGYVLLAPHSSGGVSVIPYAGIRQSGVTVRTHF
jgi:hypothetical protein